MSPEFPFKGQPRHWYVAPFIAGVSLIVVGLLIIFFPRILAFLIALPLILLGVALTLVGLDLWRGVHGWRQWRDRFRFSRWHSGPPNDFP